MTCKHWLTLSMLAATCCLMIFFANNLDPDQDRQNVGPDLDPNRLKRLSADASKERGEHFFGFNQVYNQVTV